MRIRKLMKKSRIVAAAVVALSVICMYLPAAQAADLIRTDEMCSLRLEVPQGSVYLSDSGAPEIPVDLYRVASVSAARSFTMLGDYGVDIQTLSEADNTDWVSAAQTAASNLDGKTAAGSISINPATGVGEANDLATGMYLVVPQVAVSPTYEYTFEPYFISLPHNQYYESGDPSDDQWNYEPVSEVKIGQESRFGSLEIVKNLTTYNESLGEAVFVFTIEGNDATRPYSQTVSIVFDAESGGRVSRIVDDIPVGIVVTVTEEQGTTSYELVSEEVQTATIVADDTEGAPARVEFTNQYNEGMNRGTSVENQFTYWEGEGWTVHQEFSSTVVSDTTGQ